ncbi:hypothetical protein CSPHI_10875 [Corynebacterium sphenisci DSM 44792]|uniref:Uncharacterized protein n=2 Tax=Corynebacterium sphenisci TaxID=191493 RepID=A0A1L7CZU1_9CORY|nr:hypothetical protein CSPHI_10875 [Corynebacterium sphenisci DSM 44792]
MNPLRRMSRVVYDNRWDGVALLNLLPAPEGRPQPGYGGIGRGTLTAMFRRSYPGVQLIFLEDLPETADASAALGLMHEALAARGGLGVDEIVAARAGRRMLCAISHRHGDGPTVLSSLFPHCAYVEGGPAKRVPEGFGRRRVTLPAIIAAAATAALRRPATAVHAIREAFAEERAVAGAPPPRLQPARGRYRVLRFTRPDPADRGPRAIDRAVRWRAGVARALGPGALDPWQSWLIVTLRWHPLLAMRAGNATTRIRMPAHPDEEVAIARTRRRARSAFPLFRAGFSATVQQARQLAALPLPEHHARSCGYGLTAEAPTRGLATAWTHNRFDDDAPEGIATSAVFPGLIAANVYDRGPDSTIIVSAYVDEATMAAIVAATRGMMTSFGYEERDPA